ncbi:hypothetical protein NHF50_09440 [Flavobacterium sp. NRK F10]|uniref:hypothetical protein n=1 Tax=Flavobacterium sp. NRK F10 TaxID=2954931 RepID=UPI002090333C|nr:hypothetical protein [Flavobacterium sp. NRK F10]MCO6175269.1 hypothetical protein [Flavobacterium sp. NRK F10]
MERNKFERIAKEKLAKREMKPSDVAWDRLDAMLATQEQPKKKRNFWFYIAASLFVVLGVSYWFTKSDNNEMIIPEHNIVTAPEVQAKEIKENPEKEVVAPEIVLQRQQSIAQKEDKVVVPLENIQETAVAENVETVVIPSASGIQAEREEVAYHYVTPEELLAAVEGGDTKKVISEKTNNEKSKLNVNAEELLSSVEGEIKTEYRESTLNKISKNYNKVRSALASRNYQE